MIFQTVLSIRNFTPGGVKNEDLLPKAKLRGSFPKSGNLRGVPHFEERVIDYQQRMSWDVRGEGWERLSRHRK